MKVIIVGGTGFIGYYSTLEFLNRGHHVSTISLPDIDIGDWFPKEVDIEYGNIFDMKKDELIELFRGYDAMVYAVGPDDRVEPKGSAHEFFHERLVEACGRVVSAARDAGVSKCVVLNSYFSYIDRVRPELKLAQHHPYIKCRNEQAERAIAEGEDKMDVMVLELPYIFGAMPERVPLWKDILVKMLLEQKVILYPKGGSNMVAVENVAEAVVGAVLRGVHGRRYQVGDVNLSWVQMIKLMLTSMGMSSKKIISVPLFLVRIKGRSIMRENKSKGIETGLDPLHLFKDIMCQQFYFDATESAEELGYSRGGIEKSIDDTIKACLHE